MTITDYKRVQTCSMPISENIMNMVWGMVNAALFRFTCSKFSLFRYWRVFFMCFRL